MDSKKHPHSDYERPPAEIRRRQRMLAALASTGVFFGVFLPLVIILLYEIAGKSDAVQFLAIATSLLAGLAAAKLTYTGMARKWRVF